MCGSIPIARSISLDDSITLTWLSYRNLREIADFVLNRLLSALETFRALGIAFVSISELVDTTTAMGKLLFTILAGRPDGSRRMLRTCGSCRTSCGPHFRKPEKR